MTVGITSTTIYLKIQRDDYEEITFIIPISAVHTIQQSIGR